MKRTMLLLAGSCWLCSCSTTKSTTKAVASAVVQEKLPQITQPMQVGSGIAVYNGSALTYQRDGKSKFKLNFAEPVVVSVAQKPEKWGYFQFPDIARNPDGKLVINWAVNDDAMEAYGNEVGESATSADGGRTWQLEHRKAVITGVVLPNGDRLAITTPKPLPVEGIKLPRPVGVASENYRKSNFTFYKMRDLPMNVQGVFLKRLRRGETTWQNEQGSLHDANATRYELSGKIPVVWWGDMHVAADKSLIAGIYPGNWVRNDGSFDNKNNIFFYRSTDNGKSWNVQGRLMYQPDPAKDPMFDKRMGLLEPAYEILKDGTFVCVTRTTDGSGLGPMYISYSKDMGKTWTKPEVMSANGVLPKLLQLDNGVVVLASGRPGVQLRFADYRDKKWSQPFEMLPYDDVKATVSCGYTGLVRTGKNSFIIVYSDFNYPTANGPRKAIKVREVTVDHL